MTTDGNQTEDSETSGDEVELETLLPPPRLVNDRKSRISISAEAYGELNKKKDHCPPVHPKSEEEKQQILSWLKDDFLFRNLKMKELEIIGDAIEKVPVGKDQIIMT